MLSFKVNDGALHRLSCQIVYFSVYQWILDSKSNEAIRGHYNVRQDSHVLLARNSGVFLLTNVMLYWQFVTLSQQTIKSPFALGSILFDPKINVFLRFSIQKKTELTQGSNWQVKSGHHILSESDTHCTLHWTLIWMLNLERGKE